METAGVPMFGGEEEEHKNLKGSRLKSSKSGDDRHIHDQAPASVGPRSISLDLPVSVFCHSTTQKEHQASLPQA